MAGFGTLTEVREQWSIDDLMDANDLVLLREQAEAESAKRIQEAGR